MWSLTMFSLAIATTILGVLGQASNFVVSPEVAAEYGCGVVCQENLNTSNTQDLRDFDMPFDFDFYTTAHNFSGSKPGDVLKLSPVDPNLTQIPAGIAAYKIQYASIDLNGTTIPATGFIAFPFVQTRDAFKLVAYAHGTSGVFRGCAPSTSSMFYDYDTWIPLLLTGYAVVATDYAGLGNNYSSHKYISAVANANDVYWSAIAAQKAFPSFLSKEWISIGHSQGGGASWKLSEHALVQDTQSGYLGGVALAPNTRIYDAIIEGASMVKDLSDQRPRDTGSAAYVPSIYFALRAIYPDYDAPFLSAVAKKRFELGERAQLCAAALPAVVSDLNSSDIISNFDEDAFATVKEFQTLNAPAQGQKTSRPLLVIQGANDTTVLPSITTSAYHDACDFGNRIHLSMYPGLDHSAVSGASAPEWLQFIDNLFHGHSLQNCSSRVVELFNLDLARKPTDF